MSLRVSDDVRFRVVAGEAVVIRQRAAEVVVLNEVGARVLELVDQGVDLARMALVLEQEFDVALPQLDADVRAFVNELAEAEILETDGR